MIPKSIFLCVIIQFCGTGVGTGVAAIVGIALGVGLREGDALVVAAKTVKVVI